MNYITCGSSLPELLPALDHSFMSFNAHHNFDNDLASCDGVFVNLIARYETHLHCYSGRQGEGELQK